jgi:hypothetical protein
MATASGSGVAAPSGTTTMAQRPAPHQKTLSPERPRPELHVEETGNLKRVAKTAHRLAKPFRARQGDDFRGRHVDAGNDGGNCRP